MPIPLLSLLSSQRHPCFFNPHKQLKYAQQSHREIDTILAGLWRAKPFGFPPSALSKDFRARFIPTTSRRLTPFPKIPNNHCIRMRDASTPRGHRTFAHPETCLPVLHCGRNRPTQSNSPRRHLRHNIVYPFYDYFPTHSPGQYQFPGLPEYDDVLFDKDTRTWEVVMRLLKMEAGGFHGLAMNGLYHQSGPHVNGIRLLPFVRTLAPPHAIHNPVKKRCSVTVVSPS
ncbi:hypothetical protein DL96DRAFT_1721770 [Flagelloscypha sp. PMI_526]|nr:hypothetical protein DL96DRAFT_1721770 [Flagelloscypha sp. PMI_526]